MSANITLAILWLVVALLAATVLCIWLAKKAARVTGQSVTLTIWNMPSGVASFLAAIIAIGVAISGFFISGAIASSQEEARAREKMLETARAFEAEVFAFKVQAIVMCSITSKLTSGSHEASQFKEAMLSEPRVWEAYANNLGTLVGDPPRAIATFYALRQIANQGLRNADLPVRNKRNSMRSLVEAADLTLRELHKVTLNNPEDFLYVPEGADVCLRG